MWETEGAGMAPGPSGCRDQVDGWRAHLRQEIEGE